MIGFGPDLRIKEREDETLILGDRNTEDEKQIDRELASDLRVVVHRLEAL